MRISLLIPFGNMSKLAIGKYLALGQNTAWGEGVYSFFFITFFIEDSNKNF